MWVYIVVTIIFNGFSVDSSNPRRVPLKELNSLHLSNDSANPSNVTDSFSGFDSLKSKTSDCESCYMNTVSTLQVWTRSET